MRRKIVIFICIGLFAGYLMGYAQQEDAASLRPVAFFDRSEDNPEILASELFADKQFLKEFLEQDKIPLNNHERGVIKKRLALPKAEQMTLRELGKEIGVHPGYVPRIESRVRDKAIYFSRYLRTSIDRGNISQEPVYKLAYFSVTTQSVLGYLGIRTVGDLLGKHEKDFYGALPGRPREYSRGARTTAMHEVRQALAAYGLKLRETSSISVPLSTAYPHLNIETIRKMPISALGHLGVRAQKAIDKLGITDIGGLLDTTDDQFFELHDFGVTTMNEIRERLAGFDPETLAPFPWTDLSLSTIPKPNSAAQSPRPDIEQEKSLPLSTVYPNLNTERVRKMPISALGHLGVRAQKAIDKLGITNIGGLLDTTEDQLFAVRDFGVTAMNKIRERLAGFDPKTLAPLDMAAILTQI